MSTNKRTYPIPDISANWDWSGEHNFSDTVVGATGFGGDGSDGALAITTGTTTIDCANAPVVVKNYTSISITGDGKLAFSNPATNGTTVILMSRGDVTLSSSETPMIDMSLMGAAGGAAPGPLSSSYNLAGNNGTDGTTLIKANLGNGGTTSAGGAGGALPTDISLLPGITTAKEILYMHRTFIGAGGGSGSVHSSAVSGVGSYGGVGGRGGGCLILECLGDLDFGVTGGIAVDGEDGGDGISDSSQYRSAAGGGGGGGGFALVLYSTATDASGTVTSTGGTGGFVRGKAGSYGGGGGASGFTVGANGIAGSVVDTKCGGDGGIGGSLIAKNTIL